MAQQNTLRLRQKRRQRLIVILLLLLTAVAMAYFLFPKQVNNITRTNIIPDRPKGEVAIPIVRQNLPLGTRLSQRNTTVRYMKPQEVPTDAVIAPRQFMGRYTTGAIVAGDYIRSADVAAEGAPRGFSGLVKPGKRVIVLNAGLFPGSLVSLNAGDKIDLLSIGTPLTDNAITPNRLADSSVSIEGGGISPGDPNSVSRQRARARGGAQGTVAATTATLIAEDAEVMAAPSQGRGNNFVVLQMEPEDAHVTMLAASSGATMRIVFRPFNDPARLTPNKELAVTTRVPLPTPDPSLVTVISGSQRILQRPLQSKWDNEETNAESDDSIVELEPEIETNAGIEKK